MAPLIHQLYFGGLYPRLTGTVMRERDEELGTVFVSYESEAFITVCLTEVSFIASCCPFQVRHNGSTGQLGAPSIERITPSFIDYSLAHSPSELELGESSSERTPQMIPVPFS